MDRQDGLAQDVRASFYGITVSTAVSLRLKVTGKVEKCVDCLLTKIRKTNIPKVSENKAKEAGEKICLDVSYIKKDSMGRNKYWMIVEDQHTSFKWSF